VQDLFLQCPTDARCDYCNGRKSRPALADTLDAIYCINIQEQPKRFADMTALFHREGMCGDVTFYRAKRGRFSTLAIWRSHREVAREALRRGQSRVLVLEDDLEFLRPWGSILKSIRKAEARLLAGWFALYVGHSPLQGFFVGPAVMRVSSSTTHAYVANKPLMDWLDATPPMDPYVPVRSRVIGYGIDAAFACLPGMFALFPTNSPENARGGIGSDIGITTSSRGPGFASGSPPRYRPFTGSSCTFPKSARLYPRGSRRMCDASLMLTTTSPKIPISRPQAGPRWSTSSGSDRGKAATPTHGLIRAGTCASIPTRVRAG
jgi:hypothetical protein